MTSSTKTGKHSKVRQYEVFECLCRYDQESEEFASRENLVIKVPSVFSSSPDKSGRVKRSDGCDGPTVVSSITLPEKSSGDRNASDPIEDSVPMPPFARQNAIAAEEFCRSR